MFTHSSHKKNRPVVRTIAMLAGVLGTWLVQAQDMNERLRACDRLTDTNQKLACFDAVVKSLDESSSGPAVTAAADSAVVAPAPAASGAVPAPAASSTAPAAVAVPPQAAESATEAETPEDNFGLSQRQIAAQQQAAIPEPEAEEDAEPRSIQATIVESWSTIDGRFEARLDNGQVWRETERTRWSNRLPKVGTSVEIKKGWLGGYRMKIGDNNRLAAVRRSDR